MNEIVKYSNELHELKFNSLSETQQNVFFTLLQQFRNTDSYTLELDFNKIFELANIAQGTNYRKEILDKLGKLQEFKFRYEINELGDLRQDVIFPSMQTDTKNRRLFVKVSRGFKDRYIDSPLKGWTRYELAEFVNLSGTYTKTIYRYLKQFRQTGLWRIRYDDFKELLGIPESYQSCDIDKQILNPTIKELSAERNLFDQRRIPFKGLILKKIKKGRNIDALEFYFEPQQIADLDKDTQQNTQSPNDIKRQEMLKKINQINQNSAKELQDLSEYVGRHLHIYNEKMNVTDILKIQSFKQNGEQLEVKILNVDDNHIATMRFNDLKHFENVFGRYGS